jgi:hypothetical protein
MSRPLWTAVLAVLVASGLPLAAHHSNALYFDFANTVTLEGEVLRVEWVNPHILLYMQAKDEKGEPQTWIIQGSSNVRQVRSAMNERLKPGTPIAARVLMPRNPLYVNDQSTVLLTRPDDARRSPRIVGGGQIRFANGDIVAIGGGPKF